MGEKATESILKKIITRMKESILFFLKAIYIIPFIVFGLWLVSTVYFHGFDIRALSSVSSDKEVKEEDNVLKTIMRKKEIVPQDHFHMIDAYVERQEPNPPICVVCHGAYAHGKEKKTRSMLNMHSGFIACSVCHVRKEGGETKGGKIVKNESIELLWVDRQTGEFKNAVKGEYGKYHAMIYPIKFTEQGARRIFTPIKAEAAQEFLNMWPQLTSDQVAEAKAKLHEPLSKEAITCTDCHKKDGYLDFKKLGFPARRVDHLVSSEFVGMIENYKTFYLPSVIDFHGD